MNRPKRQRPLEGGSRRANIGIGGVAGAAMGAGSGGSTAINPDFDPNALLSTPKTEGDVSPDYKGNPTDVVNNPSLVTNKFIDTRPWYAKGAWGKFFKSEQPDTATALNSQMIANTTQAQAANQLAQNTAIQNAAKPNTYGNIPLGDIPPEVPIPAYDWDRTLPAIPDTSLGSNELNSKFIGERELNRFGTNEDLRKAKEMQAITYSPEALTGSQNLAAGNFWGGKGRFSTTNPLNRLTASNLSSEEARQTGIQFDESMTPGGEKAIRNNYNESLLFPGVRNSVMQRYEVGAGGVMKDPTTGLEIYGGHTEANPIPIRTQTIDLKTGQPTSVIHGIHDSSTYIPPKIRYKLNTSLTGTGDSSQGLQGQGQEDVTQPYISTDQQPSLKSRRAIEPKVGNSGPANLGGKPAIDTAPEQGLNQLLNQYYRQRRLSGAGRNQ